MRVELPDGQWVELRERITHGQDKEITRARARVREDATENAGDDVTTALRIFIRAWNIRDVNGEAITLEDSDAIERMPADLADQVIGSVLPLYAPSTVPNAPTPPSSAGSSSDSR